MHKSNIEAAGRETLRLLNYTYQLLDEHLAAKDLVHEADQEQQRQVDREKIALWKRAIRNEIRKVENLETVLAVIGTVKAGKSTTINAIVGAEILPSRPDPMTTYPTLVRHKAGQTEPILHFPLAHDFIELGRKAKARIQELLGDKQLNDLFPATREQESAQQVLLGRFESLVETYVGREQIFQLLELINDLCRVCAPLDLPLPAVAVEDGARLPLIEVQMYHVRAIHQDRGQFTILDSPGPNEFGQGQRLRTIVREQLNQASAVVLVCNFMQLGTDADKEIQGFVEEVLGQLTDRVFIFVNQFDQRSARDWDAEKVRKHLSQTLLNGSIPPERIFPVSSRSAFRANWALRELELNGQLPDPAVNSITEDFGNEALGILWREDIANPERTARAANRLWRGSLFDDPLDSVVRAAATNAALISLKSAVAKIVEYNGVLDRFLKIRATAATSAAEFIQAEIAELQNDITKTGESYELVLQRLEETVKDFSTFTTEVCGAATEDLSKIVDAYFKTGKVIQLAASERLRRQSTLGKLASNIESAADKVASVFESSRKAKVDATLMIEDFNPATAFDSGTGTYVLRGPTHVKDAKELLSKIRKRILEVFVAANNATQMELATGSAALSDRLQAEIDASLKDILEGAQKRFKRAFDITFKFPKPDLKISENILREFEANVIQRKSETYASYVEQKGKFGKVKRWLGDQFGEFWGYDEVIKTRDISTVNLVALSNLAMRKLGAFETEIQTQAKTFINSVLRRAVDNYFKDLRRYIEAFRGDLLDAVSDQRLKKDRLDALHDNIKKFKGDVDDILHDGTSLNAGLEAA